GVGLGPQACLPGSPAAVDAPLPPPAKANRLERIRPPPGGQRRLDDDRRVGVCSVPESRCPEVLALRPDDPELATAWLDGEDDLIRRAGGADRELAPEFASGPRRDRHVLRAGPRHEGIPDPIGDEWNTVRSRQRLRVRSRGQIDRRADRRGGVVEDLVEVPRLRGRVRPEGELRKAGGVDNKRLVVTATRGER